MKLRPVRAVALVSLMAGVACLAELVPEAGSAPCVVLPGAWENQTLAFRVTARGAATPLELTDSVAGDTWHNRAGAHPKGHTVYLASHLPVRGIFLSAYRFDPGSCTFGPRISHLAPTRDTAVSKRYYGVEPSPDGRFVFQTTEAAGTIRSYRVAADGSLTFVGSQDVRLGGKHRCVQVRRLEISADGRSLYANCNNFGGSAAVQHWRIADDGTLTVGRHVSLPAMDGGVFDPVLHPSGGWLYQPVYTNDSTAPEGTGMYVVRFQVGPDGSLGALTPQRVDDPDLNGPGPEPGSTSDGVYASTVLFHPDGLTAYLTTANAIDGRSWVMVADVDPATGALTIRDRIAVSEHAGTHHGGTLVPDVSGGLLLVTFVTDYVTGRLEVMRVTGDGGLEPTDPPAVATRLRDARHPTAVLGR